MRKNLKLLASLFLLIFLANSCVSPKNPRTMIDPNKTDVLISGKKKILKAHLNSGELIVYEPNWNFDSNSGYLSGSGFKYSMKRDIQINGEHKVHIDSVAIFEMNEALATNANTRIVGKALIYSISGAIAVACIIDPKICFGSCPTFYMEDYSENIALAEGFSNAIAPSLAYADIDALGTFQSKENEIELIMRNEALETHVIQGLELLAIPKKDGLNILHGTDNKFYQCSKETLLEASSTNENQFHLLRNKDRKEWFIPSNPENLKSPSKLSLNFGQLDPNKKYGLKLNYRQSLMTTYIIYSALDYMGPDIGNYFQRIESGFNVKDKLNQGIKAELGEIEVYTLNQKSEEWEFQGSFYETGPIAMNEQVLPINLSNFGNTEIVLKLNEGLWRIDQASLVEIDREVIPESLTLKSYAGELDSLPKTINPTEDQPLISLPGNEYRFTFQSALDQQDYHLFLNAKGYYIEWMREEWAQSSNPRKLYQLFEKSKTYLKQEAEAYKQYETELEPFFWKSRINTKEQSRYDY